MADVTQNISAQLFVKELPAANRADFSGCKQDFNSPQFTTCINELQADNAVENAFQKQLNLSEYYKSPEVFNTLKNSYMEKTMESNFETEQIDLNVKNFPPEVSSASQSTPVGPRDFIQSKVSLKESFGAMGESSNLIIYIIIAILLFIFLKKN